MSEHRSGQTVMGRYQRRSIREEPDHAAAREYPPEPGIHPGVPELEIEESTTGSLRWVNREKDPADAATVTDIGSLRMDAIRTVSVEFRLSEPSGASLKCTCNDCWLTYWIPPFAEAVECPRCHARKVNIATEPNIGGDGDE